MLFNSILHKEPLMELAMGLAVLGIVNIWKRPNLQGIALMALASTIAIVTRNYAGYFLLGACVFASLHAALVGLGRNTSRAIPLLIAAGGIIAVTLPTAIHAAAGPALQTLRSSESFNTVLPGHLGLAPRDTSSLGAVFGSTPQRVLDVLFKPYPWQISNLSQQLGMLGTLAVLALLFLLIRYAWICRGSIVARAGPLAYPLGFLLVAYSISAGNSGTSFRYRSTLVVLGVGLLVVLRDGASEITGQAPPVTWRRPQQGSSHRGPAETLPIGFHGTC